MKNILIISLTFSLTSYIVSIISFINNIYLKCLLKLIICIIVPNICFLIIFYKNNDLKFIKNYIFNILRNRIKNSIKINRFYIKNKN